MSNRGTGFAVAAVMIAAALTGCATTDALYADYLTPLARKIVVSSPLSEEALRKIYDDGPRMSIKWVDGSSGELAFGRDGRLDLVADGKTHQGRWSIHGSSLCTQFGEDREVRCFRQYSGGQLFDVFTGSRHGVVSRI